MNSKTVAFWVMIVFILALGIYTIHWIRSESYTCVNTPEKYLINRLEESNGAPVHAIFTVEEQNGASVYLDKDGFSPIRLK